MFSPIKLKNLLPAAIAAGVVLGSSAFTEVRAASFSLTPFTGSLAEVLISLDESDGDINVNVSTNTNVALADLRGVFFNVANEAILPQLNVINASSAIQSWQFKANSIIEVGSKNNNKAELQGEPSLNPCLSGSSGCDGGLLIGTNGIGKDDIQAVQWTFTRKDGKALTLADFEGMAWGVRATSVGSGGSREGSSKLSGTFKSDPAPVQVPEPNGALALLSVTALGVVLRRRSISA